QDGDWYVQAPGASPLAAALSGVAWDSLPPASSLAELRLDSASTVVLTARLARRGPPRPVIVLTDQAGAARAIIAAGGPYRWALRERWWLFFAAIALFAAEWAWRRRQGLP